MGRHALLEAHDVSETTRPDGSAAADSSEVRTVAEIIAAFRREQDTLDSGVPQAPADPTPAPVVTRTTGDDDASDDDGPTGSGPGVTVDPRREAAWAAALRPTGSSPQPRRRRAANGAGASAVIASLTAELAEVHPGLLDGSPHSRRAAAPARRTAAAGTAATLRPVRVSGGLRGAALRVPALTGGWRLPTRTPLVLAGAVAVSVVVTDQAGLLTASDAVAGNSAAAADLSDVTPATTTESDAEAARGVAEAQTRVSRLERSPLTTADPTAAATGATPAGTGTAIAAAPPPDSVMKPGQTIPGDWVRPSATGTYNSCFCARWGTMHEGIDFAAPLGSPILAVGDGTVVQAGPASGFGNWVIIRHDNGDVTIYGHMRYYFVKVGQRVAAGQEIALVGAEGQSTGPHLHLGVKTNSTDGHDGTYIDPVPWLVARGVDVGAYNQNG